MPIAIAAHLSYEAVTIQLHPGDVVAMYTDGVNEAMNSAGEQFGTDTVRNRIAEGGGAEEVSERMIQSLQRHFDGRAADDDICLVVIERIADQPLSATTAGD